MHAKKGISQQLISRMADIRWHQLSSCGHFQKQRIRSANVGEFAKTYENASREDGGVLEITALEIALAKKKHGDHSKFDFGWSSHS
jgi:hypothetical protein